MVKPGNSPGLTLKETDGIFGCISARVTSCLGSAYLDSNLLVDARIFCQVDLTHTSASEQTNEAVLTELQSFERHFSPRLKKISKSIVKIQVCNGVTITHQCRMWKHGKPFSLV